MEGVVEESIEGQKKLNRGHQCVHVITSGGIRDPALRFRFRRTSPSFLPASEIMMEILQ